jgi:hypothetical protein
MTTVQTRRSVATHEAEEGSLPGLAQAEALPKLFERWNRGGDVNSACHRFYFNSMPSEVPRGFGTRLVSKLSEPQPASARRGERGDWL